MADSSEQDLDMRKHNQEQLHVSLREMNNTPCKEIETSTWSDLYKVHQRALAWWKLNESFSKYKMHIFAIYWVYQWRLKKTGPVVAEI